MLLLVVGLFLFLGVHSISIAGSGLRRRVIDRSGEGAWKGGYAVIAAAGLCMICVGFHLARYTPIIVYLPPLWLRHIALLLMLPVFPLLIAAYLPGKIKTAAKHPMLAAVKFWAAAHLLANGMLADVLLFGGFLAWAVIDRVSLKRRPPQTVPAAPASAWNDAIAVILGLAIYVILLMWAHVRLFGVSPLS